MAKKSLPTPELLRKFLRYEPETGKLYWRERTPDMFKTHRAYKTWSTRYSDKEAFTAPSHGYKSGTLFGTNVGAHRVIWAIVHGEWPPEDIDHINGIRNDNRIVNLRAVSRTENCKNQRITKRNTSGVMGVSWNKLSRKWRARIWVHGRENNLGQFTEKSAAIATRKVAEAKYGYHKNHGR